MTKPPADAMFRGDLPEFWRQKLSKLQLENRNLRQRLAEANRAEPPGRSVSDMDEAAQRTIRSLRDDCAKYRIKLQASQAELAELKAEASQ